MLASIIIYNRNGKNPNPPTAAAVPLPLTREARGNTCQGLFHGICKTSVFDGNTEVFLVSLVKGRGTAAAVGGFQIQYLFDFLLISNL